VVSGEVEVVGQDGDGPAPGEAEPLGRVEVERRLAPEARPLVEGHRGRHGRVGVQAEHGRAGGQEHPPGGRQVGAAGVADLDAGDTER
jgi:hypothetical protein